MTQQTDNKQETYEYKAEMKQLLHLIVHSLYTHPEIFLRELISNASDALNKLRYRQLTDKDILDADAELKITITLDKDKKLFTIEDNGIGMTREQLIENIGTVARSGTLEFLKQVQEAGDSAGEKLIGQFGVGFYSVFMVTDEVTIETREASKDATAYRWTSSGEGSYTIEEIQKETRGTKITFTLKEEAKEYGEDYSVKSIINKYSNFADFPIFLGKEKVNTIDALWRKNENELKKEELEEFYKFISNDYEAPLDHMHLSIEGTAANFKALLFIPSKAPVDFMRSPDLKSVHLYSNKIMIQDDCKDLLPEYLRFLRGVVDTTDLPLNVSREMIQNSPVMGKIRGALTTKVLNWLKSLSNNETEKFMTFYKNFGPLFKAGLNMDFANRDKIIALLRFQSSQKKADEMTSLKDYVSRMKPEQKEIYYLAGDNRSALERNPNLEYFRKNDIEVLFLTDPMDSFIIPSVGAFEEKQLKSIDKADIDVLPEKKIETQEDGLTTSLLKSFKETLKDKVEDVVESKRLVDSIATLVAGKDAMDPQMERILKMMQKETPAGKRILEVNMQHPVLKNLSKMYLANPSDPFIPKCIEQIFEGALFIDGEVRNPVDYVKRMTEIMQRATDV